MGFCAAVEFSRNVLECSTSFLHLRLNRRMSVHNVALIHLRSFFFLKYSSRGCHLGVTLKLRHDHKVTPVEKREREK